MLGVFEGFWRERTGPIFSGRRKEETYLKLPSCSRMLCRLRSSRSRVVAFGVGTVVRANSNRISDSDWLMFRYVEKVVLS